VLQHSCHILQYTAPNAPSSGSSMRPTLGPEYMPAFDVVLHTRLTLFSGQDVVHVAPRHRSSREAKATLEGTRCQLHGQPHHLCIHSSPIPICPWPCSLRLGPCVNCRFADGAKSRRVLRSQHLLPSSTCSYISSPSFILSIHIFISWKHYQIPTHDRQSRSVQLKGALCDRLCGKVA
jgi:hypothetical protein